MSEQFNPYGPNLTEEDQLSSTKNVEFGFKFGSLLVTRTCSDGNGAHVISIATPKAKFSVRATKTGQVRFYDNQGNECELVNKDYVNQLESK